MVARNAPSALGFCGLCAPVVTGLFQGKTEWGEGCRVLGLFLLLVAVPPQVDILAESRGDSEESLGKGGVYLGVCAVLCHTLWVCFEALEFLLLPLLHCTMGIEEGFEFGGPGVSCCLL